MIYIDKYAYISKLKHQDPRYKLFFCMLSLVVCLGADSVIVSVLMILIMGWYTVRKGGIPFPLFMKLMLLPMSFLVIGVITIGVNASKEQSAFLFSISAFETYIGVSWTGIQSAVRLFFKALAAVSCLYYLSLSTPMVDLLQVLGKLRVPKLFVELTGLIYRFIFVLLETADRMFTAQKSRMGYAGLSAGYRSLAALASVLFIRAYKRSDELYTALEARGYDGELNVLAEPFAIDPSQYMAAIGINVVLVGFALILRYFAGGWL